MTLDINKYKPLGDKKNSEYFMIILRASMSDAKVVASTISSAASVR